MSVGGGNVGVRVWECEWECESVGGGSVGASCEYCYIPKSRYGGIEVCRDQ